MKRQLNYCPSRELSFMIRERQHNKALLRSVLHQFHQFCCCAGNWEAQERKDAPGSQGQDEILQCTPRGVCVCTAHLWPGSAHLPTLPNLGTWNCHVPSVVHGDRLGLPASDRTRINFLGKLALSLLSLQPLYGAAKAFCFHTLLRHVPTHRQDKTVPSN